MTDFLTHLPKRVVVVVVVVVVVAVVRPSVIGAYAEEGWRLGMEDGMLGGEAVAVANTGETATTNSITIVVMVIDMVIVMVLVIIALVLIFLYATPILGRLICFDFCCLRVFVVDVVVVAEEWGYYH